MFFFLRLRFKIKRSKGMEEFFDRKCVQMPRGKDV